MSFAVKNLPSTRGIFSEEKYPVLTVMIWHSSSCPRAVGRPSTTKRIVPPPPLAVVPDGLPTPTAPRERLGRAPEVGMEAAPGGPVVGGGRAVRWREAGQVQS